MKTLLSWSTGKDCAWALHLLRRQGVEVSALFTTFNEAFGRVAMHGVRRELARAQAAAAGLPLIEIPIPWPCANADYERIMGGFVAGAQAEGVTHMAFGDLFLRDIRAYREERLAGTGGAAATTLRELDDRATREGFGAIWSARAKAELALTLLADGKAGEARAAFQSAGSAADNALGTPSPDDDELRALKTMARVGEGETYLGERDFDRAEQFFRSLTTGGQPELVAAGHAGEGQAIFEAAVANNRPDEFRRAQIALAKACVFDVTSGESTAKANYYLGRCLMALGPEREGDNFKMRANAYFETVVTGYPSSPWASAAKIEQSK